MNDVRDIIYQNDLARLSKFELRDLCLAMKIDHNGVASVLAERIWGLLESNEDKLNLLAEVEKSLLAGKVSVTWFIVEKGISLKEIKAKVIKECNFDPFQVKKTLKASEIDENPILIAAAMGNTDKECYFRYIHKLGRKQYFDGTSQIEIPTTTITTLYVNEDLNLIELRGDGKKSQKILSCFANFLGENPLIRPVEIFKNFNSNIEDIVELLNGELIETTSRPDLLLNDLSDTHMKGVMRVLEALNSFFDKNDGEELLEALTKEKETFGDLILATTPFAALILGGIETVALRSRGNKDLKQQSLYDYLKPYMTHHSGYLKFKYMNKEFTVQVGATTQSIFFRTPANEDVINFVRESIIKAVIEENKEQ